MVKPVNRYLLIIAIGFCAASCKADYGPWTEPYDSYRSGVKVNGKEYHVPRRLSIDYGGLSVDDILKIDIDCVMTATDYDTNPDRIGLAFESYVDSCSLSGEVFHFGEIVGEHQIFSSYRDSLLGCFYYPEEWGIIEVPKIFSFVEFQNKIFDVKSGTITFWVGRSWAGAEPRERLWSFKRCNFEFVAEASDGERIVVTEGYLGRK